MKTLNESQIKAIGKIVKKLSTDCENKANEHINLKDVLAYNMLLLFFERRANTQTMEASVLNGYIRCRWHFSKSSAWIIYKDDVLKNIAIEAIGIEIKKELPELMADIDKEFEYIGKEPTRYFM